MQSAFHGRTWIHITSSSHLGQCGGQTPGLSIQETHSGCSRMAQHPLVLGSSGHVEPDSLVPARPAQPTHTAIQSDPL